MITRKHAKIVGKRESERERESTQKLYGRESERERACKKLYSKDHDLYKEKPKF